MKKYLSSSCDKKILEDLYQIELEGDHEVASTAP